jgi:Zn-dependent metalloprotease
MKLFLSILFLIPAFLMNSQQAKYNPESYSIERYNDDKTSPKYIFFTNAHVTPENFLQQLTLLKGLEYIGFRLLNIETDPHGNHHYRYVQVANGMDIIGSMWIAHEQKGIITSCNGEIFATPKSFSFLHTGTEALNKVLSQNPTTIYYFQQANAAKEMQKITGDVTSTFTPKPYLAILPGKLNEMHHATQLVYVIDLYASQPLSRKVYYVDANTLEILFTEDKIETTNVPGKANTKYSGVQDIVADSTQPGAYHLQESSRGTGNGIETYNMQKGTVYNTAINFTDADNYWSNFNANFDEVSGDVHWGAEKTYDFYKSVFNRNSIDNNGMKLKSYVHYSTNYINAFWNGYFMTYGDGGSGYLPLTSLDVCGHEITHGLTQKTAALVYANESGALNESFSDIFGVSIDFYTRPASANFRIGEQFGPGGAGLRDMSNPKIYQNPSTYKGQYWITNKSDNGGVHYNSGVQNKWFYLLSKGETGTNDNGWNYQVDSIGYLKAAQITYKSLTEFLTPLSNYEDARFYSILAAKQLFGDCSNEVKQVINAWYAVGVGAAADTSVKALFTSTKTSSCSVPFTVQFYNNSINGISFTWDFGDGQTSAQMNPNHTYNTLGNYTAKLIATSCNGISKDSLVLSQYITIDPNLAECRLTVMPTSGTGNVLTACAGTLRDDGDTSNYGSLVYSIRSIVPASSSVLKLQFKQFDLENNFDFLYVYDGADTLGRLIGKYTGSNLPEGGTLICKTGAATFRETSDYLVTGKGFEVDWQCIAKTQTDFRLEAVSEKITGRKYTSSELKQTQNIPAKVTSTGTQTGASTVFKYKLNNGSILSKSVTLVAGAADINIGPLDLGQVGQYTLLAWIEDSNDGIKENDTLEFTIQQLDNAPITLPLVENFDTMADVWNYSKTDAVGGNSRFDYDNTSAQCRLRTNAGTDFVAGVRSITLDKSDRNWLFDTLPQTNFITLTYNMSNVAKLNSPLLFRFNYVQHGDKQYPNDAVWLRGCDTCAWIKFFDLFVGKGAAGISKLIPIYNLNYFLDSAKQTLSSSFQLRIGQEDQNSAINSQQYTGYTFDNLRFTTWKTGINDFEKNEIIKIYPNPSKGIFIINTTEIFTRLEITDLNGRVLVTYPLPSTSYFEMDLSILEKSVYIANFFDKKGTAHAKRLVIR